MGVRAVMQCCMESFREGRPAKVLDILGRVQVGRKECEEIFLQIKEEIKDFGYDLLPGSTGRVDASGESVPVESTFSEFTHVLESFSKCDYVFVIRRRSFSDQRNVRVGEILFLHVLLLLNEEDMEEGAVLRALASLGRSEETLRYAVQEKYLRRYRKNEVQMVRRGWRFFFEFPGMCMDEYLKKIKDQNKFY